MSDVAMASRPKTLLKTAVQYHACSADGSVSRPNVRSRTLSGIGSRVKVPPAPVHKKRTKKCFAQERRREQCRRSQARCRARQDDTITRLAAASVSLQVDILQLELHQQRLFTGHHMLEKCVNVINELCRLFRYGLHVHENISTFLQRPNQSSQLGQQVAFGRRTFPSNVHIDDLIGRKHLLTQLWRFSVYFRDVVIERCQATPLPGWSVSNLVLCSNFTLTATISAKTLQEVFPHLLSPTHPVAALLLGQRVVLPVRVECEFNDIHQITRVDWTVDFTAGLISILSIRDIAVVLGNARIYRDAYLVGTRNTEFSVQV